MEQAVAMLKERKGTRSLDDWVFEINQVVQPDDEERLRSATLNSYIQGKRNITGKGAKLLAQYFYHCKDFGMVDAISLVTLGIPYPVPNHGKD